VAKDILLQPCWFRWIIPLGIIFLLWGYLGKKMGCMRMNFVNIGKNKADIHAETDQNITFKDSAGLRRSNRSCRKSLNFYGIPITSNACENTCQKGCSWGSSWHRKDPACPGRFVRQIVVDKPDLLGRIDILKIHP